MTAVIRFAYAIQTFKTDDFFWLYSKDMIWCMLELNTGLICACVPTLKPLVKSVNSKLSSFRKLSENENALQDGGEQQHRLQLWRSHDKARAQVTPKSMEMGRVPSEDTMSGLETCNQTIRKTLTQETFDSCP